MTSVVSHRSLGHPAAFELMMGMPTTGSVVRLVNESGGPRSFRFVTDAPPDADGLKDFAVNHRRARSAGNDCGFRPVGRRPVAFRRTSFCKAHQHGIPAFTASYVPGDDTHLWIVSIFAPASALRETISQTRRHCFMLALSLVKFGGKLELGKQLAAAFGVMGLRTMNGSVVYASHWPADSPDRLPPCRGRMNMRNGFSIY